MSEFRINYDHSFKLQDLRNPVPNSGLRQESTLKIPDTVLKGFSENRMFSGNHFQNSEFIQEIIFEILVFPGNHFHNSGFTR